MQNVKMPVSDFEKDISDIAKIPIVANLLAVICNTTKMRFAAIARVTEDRWVTCSVRDEIEFGLKPGDELEIKTTICNEIRQTNSAVVIDNVSLDFNFRNHHTPAKYGFQSYISVPITKKDGTFFGTLCAIDPEPNQLDSPQVVGMFTLFAELISFHLDAIDQIDFGQQQLRKSQFFSETLEEKIKERTQELEENNTMLEKMNKELQAFAYISSHDLQEPLRKIQTFASIIAERDAHNLSETGKSYFNRMEIAAERMQTLINDLLVFSRTNIDGGTFEMTNLNKLLLDIEDDLKEEIQSKNATIQSGELPEIAVISFQFRQLLYNLVSNALKFSDASRAPRIKIQSELVKGALLGLEGLMPEIIYFHMTVSDNGIGFEQQYPEKLFELFQRFHDRNVYAGTGIGLAIVKKIVENHNGLIFAKGKIGEGATFDCYIPIR